MQPYSNPTRRNVEDDLSIFENGRQHHFFSEGRLPHFFWKWKTTKKKIEPKKEKYKQFKKIKWKTTSFFKIKTTSTKIMQPKAIKSRNNGCGTAPGNLVLRFNCQGEQNTPSIPKSTLIFK
jgi:hypothetical protein